MTPFSLRRWIIFVSLVATCACDPPPDVPLLGESDTVDTEETDSFDTADTEYDSETDIDTDTELPAGSTCAEAVLCMVMNMDDALSCMADLDEDDKAAAINLSLCAAMQCLELGDDPLNLGLCLVMSCQEESVDCMGTSITELFP